MWQSTVLSKSYIAKFKYSPITLPINSFDYLTAWKGFLNDMRDTRMQKKGSLFPLISILRYSVAFNQGRLTNTYHVFFLLGSRLFCGFMTASNFLSSWYSEAKLFLSEIVLYYYMYSVIPTGRRNLGTYKRSCFFFLIGKNNILLGRGKVIPTKNWKIQAEGQSPILQYLRA